MARYKKIYPKDEEYEQMKKQDKIRSIVTYTFVSLWLVGLVLCKVFQDNNTAVGIISLTIAIATTAYCIFSFRVRRLGWKLRDRVYDTDEIHYSPFYHSVFKEKIEERRKHDEGWLLAVDICFAILGICCYIYAIILFAKQA